MLITGLAQEDYRDPLRQNENDLSLVTKHTIIFNDQCY